ncbi:DUF7882 family protein [Microbacterium sp.]|uniref:DUF7882 family protein n=1 Tax=Microbacterium sp. TaxID=51671 RepID=UPI003F7252BC
MGHLIYGVAPAIQIDDWGLLHLQAVIMTKIRRNESFSFNWDDEPRVGGDESSAAPAQHGSVWISKSSSLYFSYDGPRDRPLNREWLEELSRVASGTTGLRLVPEPE